MALTAEYSTNGATGFWARHRRFLITGLVALMSLLFLGFFPESDRVAPVVQGIIVTAVFFLVIPVIYCKIILKEPLSRMGFGPGQGGLFAGFIGIAGAFGIILILDAFYPVREEYTLSALVEENFRWFILYELFIVPATLLVYEVFFRGFLQMLWLKNSPLAVLIQAAVFASLFVVEPSWAIAPYLVACLMAGVVAYVSHSIRYSFAASWIFFILVDVCFLVLR